jgi:hypothetical protein
MCGCLVTTSCNQCHMYKRKQTPAAATSDLSQTTTIGLTVVLWYCHRNIRGIRTARLRSLSSGTLSFGLSFFGPSSGSALGTIMASTYQTLVSNQRSFIQLVFIFSSLQVRQTQGRVFIFDGRTFFSPNSCRDVTLSLQHLLAVGQALRDAC